MDLKVCRKRGESNCSTFMLHCLNAEQLNGSPSYRGNRCVVGGATSSGRRVTSVGVEPGREDETPPLGKSLTPVKVALSKPAYFAERFHLAMKGSGTRHKDLIRLLVSRSEYDLKDIKYRYKTLYGKSLCQAIKEEKLKGDYENIMLSLCGPDN